MFELDSSNKENIKIEVCSLVKGWIVRDGRIIPEKKTVLADNEESFDPPPSRIQTPVGIFYDGT